MRIVLVAVGRLKAGPERELYDRYRARFDALGRKHALGPLTLVELPESRAGDVVSRVADEAQRVIKAIGPADTRIALDGRGTPLASIDFARHIARLRDDGAQTLALLIGGPDGHGPAALATVASTLSLGPMTLPHGLARIVLAEQLYRAATIIAGHPYHRA